MQNARMETLEQRHSRLDREIMSESRKPGSNDLHLNQMKRERLSLKDQLAVLQS